MISRAATLTNWLDERLSAHRYPGSEVQVDHDGVFPIKDDPPDAPMFRRMESYFARVTLPKVGGPRKEEELMNMLAAEMETDPTLPGTLEANRVWSEQRDFDDSEERGRLTFRVTVSG